MKQIFPGVYRFKNDIATENLAVGTRVYDERLIQAEKTEFRSWDPYRSKLAAAIMNGLKDFPLREDSDVLYLGASSGTTPSHVSDICRRGTVYALEYAKRMMRDLYRVCEKRDNMVPILGDARFPEKYAPMISKVDFIYQDIAQPNQAEILLKNAEVFKPRYAMLAIKSRSIDATRSPKQIFREETEKIKTRFDVLQSINLNPYDKDHLLLNLKAKMR